MKPTGKLHPIFGHEIMEIEEHDIKWQNKEWEELTLNEKGDFLSFIKAPFLNKDIEPMFIKKYKYYRDKNLKTPEMLAWVFFGSQGVKDGADIMRSLILCQTICLQGEKATVKSVKETAAFVGAAYDIADSLLTDAKIQEMIDWKFKK
jgi:hypothetical protein